MVDVIYFAWIKPFTKIYYVKNNSKWKKNKTIFFSKFFYFSVTIGTDAEAEGINADGIDSDERRQAYIYIKTIKQSRKFD